MLRTGSASASRPSPPRDRRRSSRRKMAIFARNFAGSDLPPPAAISGDQGYPACGQAPYVALVVPAYGEILYMC
ncbi:organic cation/carnitine transporter 3 [Prunus dulcis]|uniref:Organic cation/carnitine transporter 3 n=1 Tax=Prunus dulcis TaxID=3755 RepID=A0A5H2XSB3_PRUDU|nr:organic cation/carnitine transporter 3 [Prunus dulcis]